MEDFVTFEIAKKLKEKGFSELCLAYYTNDDTLYYNYSHKAGASYTDCYLSHNLMPKDSVSGKFVDSPTISRVLKWLREEKDIYITIFIDDDSDTPVTYEIYKGIECVCTHQGEYFTLKDWDKCELRAVEYTLDNLI